MNPVIQGAFVSLILSLITAIIGFLMARYWYTKSTAAELARSRKAIDDSFSAKIAELEKQQAAMHQQVLPISTAFQAILIKELTHFHTPKMDALMVKLGPPYVLNEAEEIELSIALKERAVDKASEISESERDAAQMLPMVMKRVKLEAATAVILQDLTVVAMALPAVVTEVKPDEAERTI